MKYMKKALAAVSALMICVSAAVPFTASAASLDSKVKSAIDEFVGKMDKDTVIDYISKTYNRITVAYNGADGKYYEEVYMGTTIECAADAVDAVKAAVAPYALEEKDGKYFVNIADPAKKDAIYANLKALNTVDINAESAGVETVVKSVTEEFEVVKNGFKEINSVVLDAELNADVLSGKYGALDLTLSSVVEDEDAAKKYVYKFADKFGVNPTADQIAELRSLLQENFYVDVNYEVTSKDTVKTAVLTVFDYSDKLYGDVNEDGVVDLTDLTTLSMYLLGEEVGTFSAEKADVANNGKVDIADLATLKQYLMKDNVKLGVKVK